MQTSSIEVKKVVTEGGKSAAEMTHALKNIGGGDMQKGMLEVWNSAQRVGQRGGFGKGAIFVGGIVAIGYGGYRLINKLILDKKRDRKIIDSFEKAHKATLDSDADKAVNTHS